MRGTETHVIDGKKYEFMLIPPLEALRIITRIIKRILPPLGGAFSGSNIMDIANAIDGDINIQAMTISIAQNLDENEVEETVKQLMDYVMIDGRKINFSVDFAGTLMHMMAVIAKAIEVNYSDFLDGLKGRLATIIKNASSQKANIRSTGSSGE